MKTFNQFMTEARKRPAQRASKKGVVSKRKPEDPRPEAHVTTATPGSGKTTIVKQIQSQNPKVGHHELDKSREALKVGPAHFSPKLKKHQDQGIERDAAQGNPVVVSNTSLPRQHRNASLDHLRSLGYNAKPITLPTSPRAARRRNRNRTTGRVPGNVMRAMSRQYKGINTNPRGGGALSRSEKREARKNFKQLHRKYRFTVPAMIRSGTIRRRKY